MFQGSPVNLLILKSATLPLSSTAIQIEVNHYLTVNSEDLNLSLIAFSSPNTFLRFGLKLKILTSVTSF